MQALATPLVSILHGSQAFTFSRRAVGDKTLYVPRVESVASLSATRPGTIFEDGRCWQMVPDKFYRYDDRLLYLRDLYPQVREAQIGVLALPQIKAMGVYNQHIDLPEGVRSGNHVAELFLLAAQALSTRYADLAFAFFYEGSVWLTILRKGEVLFSRSLVMKAHSDAVFHVASMLRQYGLGTDDTPLIVGGLLAQEGQLHRELSIYYMLHDLAEELQQLAHSPAYDLLIAYQQGLRQPVLS